MEDISLQLLLFPKIIIQRQSKDKMTSVMKPIIISNFTSIFLPVQSMHSIQSQKPSNFRKHQEEDFQAIKREESKLIKTDTKWLKVKTFTTQKHKHKHTHTHNIVFHLQVSMVHTLSMTMINCVYKLLKVAPRFIFRKLSLLNLQIQKQCNCNISNKQNQIINKSLLASQQ